MKFWKAFGGVLCFIGCLAALAGLLATAAPMIDNEQIRRILESFTMKSTDPVLNAVNSVILICLRQNYVVFASGAGALLIGGLMKTAAGHALRVRSGVAHESAKTSALKTKEKASARERTAAPAIQTAEKTPVKTFSAPGVADSAPGLSPYTAAAYSKALSTDGVGRPASELARKYKPGSIIASDETLPDADAGEYTGISARALKDGEADNLRGASAPGGAGVMMLCPTCGAKTSSASTYCDQCGSKMPADSAQREQLITAAANTAAKQTEWQDTRAIAQTSRTDWITQASAASDTADDGLNPDTQTDDLLANWNDFSTTMPDYAAADQAGERTRGGFSMQAGSVRGTDPLTNAVENNNANEWMRSSDKKENITSRAWSTQPLTQGLQPTRESANDRARQTYGESAPKQTSAVHFHRPVENAASLRGNSAPVDDVTLTGSDAFTYGDIEPYGEASKPADAGYPFAAPYGQKQPPAKVEPLPYSAVNSGNTLAASAAPAVKPLATQTHARRTGQESKIVSTMRGMASLAPSPDATEAQGINAAPAFVGDTAAESEYTYRNTSDASTAPPTAKAGVSAPRPRIVNTMGKKSSV